MNRFLGAIHILLAAAVAVLFVIHPFLGEAADGVWFVLSWGKAAAVILTFYFAYTWKQGLGDDASTKDFITYKVLFLAAVVLLLWFFAAWFTEFVIADSGGVSEIERALATRSWGLIDPLFVLTAGCVGFRLWEKG